MGKPRKKQVVEKENTAKTLKGIYVVCAKITPRLAIELLRKNPRCDDLDEERIRKYAEEMKAGRWRLSRTSIVYDYEYGVNDGRHRLWAAFDAGIPVKFAIALVIS